MRSINSAKRRSKKKLLAIAITLVLAAGGALGGAYALKVGPFHPTNNTPQSTPDPSLSDDTDSTPNTTSKHPTDTTSNSVKNNDVKKSGSSAASPDSAQSTTLEITSVTDNSDVVTIHTLIQKVTTLGTCQLTVKNKTNGLTYRDSAGVQALPNASTCKGFSVTKSKLGSGTWQVTIDYQVDSVSKGTASKEVEIDA
ncbi:hypothetical protein RAAC3_TM7C00001G0294 [Candidatus Saccharibacteria bacterium RAAC3_TM7_1]|nr:hypothetical protein RAAC3_TM7C00001G0294 [Candidatus Saccharibacteria bacterium RAAC3_TM7_1]